MSDLSAFIILVLCQLDAAAWASTFHVSPVQLFLSAKTSSALLTLRNETAETVRFQLSVFAWSQSPQGEILLSPTEDILFFPSLLTLTPKEERKVRVGRTTGITSSEKTYRIFFEEIPSLVQKPQEPQEGGKVNVLAKVGIPVFLEPDKRTVEGRVQEMVMRKGLLSFQVRNTGNTHFVPQQIRIKGYGSGGEALFQGKLEGWYVLAGGYRSYELELPKKECARLKSLTVEVEALELKGGKITFKEGLEVLPGACAE